MNTSITISCSECGSQVKKNIDVCEHCKRIIALNEELEKYKAIAATGNLAAEPTDADKKQGKIPFGYFAFGYMIAATLLLTLCLKKDFSLSSFPFYQVIFFILIPLVIYTGITFVREFNIWIIALLSLLLPKIIIFIALQFNIIAPIDALNSFGKAPYVFGLYVLIASLPFIVFLDKTQLRKIYGFKAIKEYLANNENDRARAEKFVLIITSILAALKTLTTIF